ncbi:unnamed protein product [Hyaloperonospora brassicae]|uniref:Uncharacterized protein n=1 Tax=Hyaloperonospora brassicae TaxID=162125 RepID=A0AAV0UQK3_HYABA|nr:unnamed protein product [Hyaloperonospora brassicae]
MQRTLRQHRCYRGPASPVGDQDKSSFVTLLGLAGVSGGVAYAYYDPDVLPERVKKWLLIQEPEGRGMSPEEYERWRAKQSGFPIAGTLIETKKEGAEPAHSKDEENVEPPGMDVGLPVPHRDVSPDEMKASLGKLLAEARMNEAAFLADIQSNRIPMSAEDRQMLQAFKDEKARLKKQLKFLKSAK